MDKAMLKAKPPVMKIQADDYFMLLILQRKVSLMSVIHAYGLIVNNRDKYYTNEFIVFNNRKFEFSIVENSIIFHNAWKLGDITESYSYTMFPTQHCLISMMNRNFDLSILVVIYSLVKNNELSSKKCELSIDIATVIFEVENDTIRLITGWKGER